jgi:hypothetical protein
MGRDLSAQVAHAQLAEQHWPALLNLTWYGGFDPLGYSVLSPPVMALSDDLAQWCTSHQQPPKPNEAATASVPTNTALTSGGTSNDRPAISRLSRTGTCSMKAA